jgi:signal transduction histidine kinase
MQASQLAEKSAQQKVTFIQNMTHQIRTPLNIIMGFGQVLRDSIKLLPVEEVKDMTAIMYHNAHSLSRMLLMLYDSSESGASAEKKCKRTSEISCNQIARESISYVKVHNPGVRIRFETTVSDSVFILTNQVYLTRTIRELIYNAVKHSDKKHIQMRVVDTQEQMLFIVEDTGPGLSKNAVQMIEKPFTKMNEESEGLGLPLCKRHAMTLGGDLVLDTSYTDGCRFILELPK